MARITVDGGAEFLAALSRLEAGREEAQKQAIYAGAKIVADAIRSNIEALPHVSDHQGLIAYRARQKTALTYTAKKGLLDGLGITKIDQDDAGNWNAKIGFDGYNDMKTKHWPEGQPNQMIARSVESGSSVVDKHPFVAPAVRSTKKAAIEAMAAALDEAARKQMEGTDGNDWLERRLRRQIWG